MIRRLLIANRGEIAIRVARTAREMGIWTTGVYSEADRDALHRRSVDESVEIGGPLAKDSYLNIESVVRAAIQARADAIHPGYGFLSENPKFARRCNEVGLAFVGPTPNAMALSGDKIASRRKMAEAGVPVTPGVDRVVRDVEDAREIATKLGYPVLFKATAGGGGIGIARVNRPAELGLAFESAGSAAESSFGSPDLFVEKFIPRARHIEVQVLIGPRGTGVHLFERECSVQRRQQKLVEETPSVALTPDQRKKLCESALNGLRRLGYTNAGTAEFLYHRGRFMFNEINARLQVEHPITETVTGVDLVRQQILIASGEAIELSQNEIVSRGHALECRINAEDPLRNFLPSPGRIVGYREPEGRGMRIDSGVALGSAVPPYYDSLISKLVVRGRTRAEIIRRMDRALSRYEIRGVHTSIPFHRAILREGAFRRGDLWTTMVSDLRVVERIRGRGGWEEAIAAVAAALVRQDAVERVATSRALEWPRTPRWAIAGRREHLAGGDRALSPRRRW